MSRSRPTGTAVSDRVNQISPLPESFILHPPSGHRFIPQDVLSMPKPVTTGRSNPPTQPSYSILMGSPLAPSAISSGSKLTVVDHRSVASASASASGAGNGTDPSDVANPRKPKNAVKNNNSMFISRGLVYDQLAKRMRDSDLSESLSLLNYERSLTLIDTAPGQQRSDPLAKIFFAKEWPLCHALNTYTQSAQQLDVIIGMSSGDLVWLDLVSQRYERINKAGNVTRAAVSAVSWLPNSESHVIAAHHDGSVVIYDVYAEDTTGGLPNYSNGDNLSLSSSDANDKHRAVKAVYHISPQPISQMLFLSPSQLVVGGKADYITLFELETEQATDLLPTFFGGVRCMEQSPDKRFLAVAGEDDMINVFDTARGMNLAARFQGHKSCVKALAFDRFQAPYEQQAGSYRLASVGEDRQVIIWDFAPLTLTAPKRPPNAMISSEITWAATAHKLEGSPVLVHGRVPQFAAKTVAPAARVYAILPEFGDSPLSDIKFTASSLLVASSDGKIWTWKRGKEEPVY